MKRLTAQYVITNTGPPLKRAIITTEDDGTIISINDTSGVLTERHSTEFYNGIIVPGFVNCHCHLELSHMKNSISTGKGLGVFIEEIRNTRDYNKDIASSYAIAADNYMYTEGIVLCADVCNTTDSFNFKKESRIRYINLLEVFGLDPEKAERRMNDIIKVSLTAKERKLSYSLVPHSAYSMSLTLFRLLRNESINNRVTSMHFMESEGEAAFLKNQNGSLMQSYERTGLIPPRLETAMNHADVVINEITSSGNLILVHNTFADSSTIKKVKARKHLFWCLCPNSNIFIENKVPPVKLLMEESCQIVIGTDSLASNTNLSILNELKTIQLYFPEISIEDLISWATINGATALGEEEKFGSITPGKKPGLLLLENIDLQNMKLLPESSVTRLV